MFPNLSLLFIIQQLYLLLPMKMESVLLWTCTVTNPPIFSCGKPIRKWVGVGGTPLLTPSLLTSSQASAWLPLAAFCLN